MASEEAVKEQVRERDSRRCCKCFMTEEEHVRQFGQRLHVHRKHYSGDTSWGWYKESECEAICFRCHQAVHHIKCFVRQRDEFVCKECGMTDEEHRNVYGYLLEVHCNLGGNCSEWEWEKKGVTADQCITLCNFCHDGRHSVRPVVLKRDNFQCAECGKKADNTRLWYSTLRVLRLIGCCEGPIVATDDPESLITLCHDCHERKHPDRLAEYIRLGGELLLPNVIRDHADKLGITLPVVRKEQLAPYKRYLLLVNAFIEHYRKHGVPKKKEELQEDVLSLPETVLDPFFRRIAAEEAVDAFGRSYSPSLTEAKAMRKMSEAERQAFLDEKEERRLEGVGRRYTKGWVIVLIEGRGRVVTLTDATPQGGSAPSS